MQGLAHHRRPLVRSISRLKTLLDRFLPAGIQGSDLDSRRRARLVAVFICVLVLSGIFYAALFWCVGSRVSAAAVAAAVAMGVGILFLLRRIGAVVAGNLTTADLFFALTASGFHQGGPASPALYWYAAIPIVAMGLAGRRWAVGWTIVTVGWLLAFSGLKLAGYQFTDELTADTRDFVCFMGLTGVIMLILVLAWTYESFKNEMLGRLRESEQRYRLVLENVDVGITLVDRDFRIILTNTAQARVFGKRPEDILAMHCYEVFGRSDVACSRCAGTKAMESGAMAEMELETTRADGTPCSVRIRAFPLVAADGSISGFIEMAEDITDRKQAEAFLQRAKEDAEAASRAKSEFLANMSHEIRTPMTAILGFSESLLDPDLSEPERIDAIQTIRRNGDHLLQIINDVLDLSKIEAGRLVVEQIECSIAAIVAEVESLIRPRALAKGLRLDVEYDGPVPEVIRTDPTRVRQILINLLGNAVKFTEAGSVRLVVRLVAAPKADGVPRLQFDVIDTGIGMSSGQLDRLFLPFHQADTSTTRRFGGTGLGLTISRHLAEALGGRIEVESTPGQGSTFRVTIATGPLDGVRMVSGLSATRTDARPVRTPSAAQQTQLLRSVLLVEDGPDNQRLISTLLRKAGAEVSVAANGREGADRALAAVAAGSPFHVVLMDMQMPVMDGYAATRLLRKKGYTGTILALTAHAMTGDRQKCLDAGCDGFITKPVDSRTLVTTILAHLPADEGLAITTPSTSDV